MNEDFEFWRREYQVLLGLIKLHESFLKSEGYTREDFEAFVDEKLEDVPTVH